MSYVGNPFEHDLFISYSHGDDGNGKGYLQPWSAAFAEALRSELCADRRFKRDLRMFLDSDHRPGQGLDPMAGLTKQLEDQIGAAAMLVVLMSPDYLDSKWCGRERDWWCARQTELGLSPDGRIAVIRIWPPEKTQPWPSALCDPQGEPLVGFLFHSDLEGYQRPIGWEDRPGDFGSDFRRAIIGIAGTLSTKLEWMKERAEVIRKAQIDAARLQLAEGQSIYLHGRKDQQAAWEGAATTLAESGYVVLPCEPDAPAVDAESREELRKRRIDALETCDALLLLGAGDGNTLDADLVRVGHYDRNSARASSNHPLPCGVLNLVSTIATPLRKMNVRNIRADWIDCTESPWTPQVQQWLAAKGAQVEQLR